VGRVDIQNVDGRPTASRPANQARPVPREVPIPALPPGIEQDHDAAGDGVAATEIARFSQIALKARPSEIGRGVRTAVFLGDDVFQES